MRSLGTRRVVLATGVATAAAIALTGCSAGQIAETALKRTSNPGVNADNADRSVYIRNLSVVYPGVEGYAAGGEAPLELSLYNQTTAPITVTISSAAPKTDVEGHEVVTASQVSISGAVPTAGASATPSTSVSPDSPDEAAPTAPTGEDEASGGPSIGASPSSSESASPSSSESASPSSSGSASPSSSASASAPAAGAGKPAQITLPAQGSAVFLPDAMSKILAVGLSDELTSGGALNLVFTFSNGVEPLELQAPISTPLSPAPRGSAENEGTGEGH